MMHTRINHEDGDAILGHSKPGRDHACAGHGDSTWVRQSMAWCEPESEHLSYTAPMFRTIDTSEHITGEVVAA